jgi:hypothetical protein
MQMRMIRIWRGRKNRARCKKTTQKIYLQKRLTRPPKLWYNFGAAKSNTFVCKMKPQTKVLICGQNKTRIIAGYY